MRELLAKGANTEAVDKFGETPLHVAAQRGNDAVARLCQMQIFFSLLASVALTSASEQNAGSNMDILLVVLYCLPVRLLCALALGCSLH